MKAVFILYIAFLVISKRVQAADDDSYDDTLDDEETRLKEINKIGTYKRLSKSEIEKLVNESEIFRKRQYWKPPTLQDLNKSFENIRKNLNINADTGSGSSFNYPKLGVGILGFTIICSLWAACCSRLKKKRPGTVIHDPEETVPAIPPESSRLSPNSFQQSPFRLQPISRTKLSIMSPQQPGLCPAQPTLNAQQPLVHPAQISPHFQRSSTPSQQHVPYPQQPICYPPPQTSYVYPTEQTTHPPPEKIAFL